MERTKFVGMDVHKDAIAIAVMNSAGKVIMESIIETKAVTILQFIHGLRGDVFVTFEEGTWASWLYLAYAQNSSRWKDAEVLDHLGPLEILL
jgi:hypothetical protein